ncbi:unnamed protein product [Caenorhabditis angaria]|uniref:L-Fucosyltransferase n=1 Tax=Caenorhabditis angaria TaxID=860376 RepID=A0A9P1IEB7_9PELO|nr:unnamed protein product [Caenorhabditis angaria]
MSFSAKFWPRKQIFATRPKKLYLTANFGTLTAAGLGNALFEIGANLGIARKIDRIPFIHGGKVAEAFDSRIKASFPGLYAKFEIFDEKINDTWIIEEPFQKLCCYFEDPARLFKNSPQFLKLGGDFYQSFKYFDENREEIRNLLIPAEKYVKLAENYMEPAENPGESFKICAHIRRGDFLTDGYHSATDPRFLRNAVRFLAREFAENRKIQVIFIGNHENFMENDVKIEQNPNFSIKILPRGEPEIDLAFSRIFCDVLLISAPSSTFGWWLGYLSKTGNLVYYRDIQEINDQVKFAMVERDFYPAHWRKLKMDEKTGEIRRV